MWQAPSPIRLEDYRPTDYIIEAVDLHFELDPARTVVHSRLVLERRDGVDGPPALVLDGQDIELLSVRLNGK